MTYDACIETIVFDRFLMHSIQRRSKHSSSIVHRSARRLLPRSFAGFCVDDFVVVVITNDPVFCVRVFLFVNLPFLEIPFVSYVLRRVTLYYVVQCIVLSEYRGRSQVLLVVFACRFNVLHCARLYRYTCCDSAYARNRAVFYHQYQVVTTAYCCTF